MASYTQNSIDTRLAMYTLAAGALVAGGAHAAPTTSPSDFPISGDAQGVQIFIDGDSEYDFILEVYSEENCTYNGGNSLLKINFSAYAGGIKSLTNSAYAGMISDGTSVSGVDDFKNRGYLATCDNTSGEFPVPSRGFVGVLFSIGENLHYGYLDVETSAGSLITTVHGACYESTPNIPIDLDACQLRDDAPARNPVAVPVGGLIPTTLALLALGAVASRRRRKTQQ